MARSCGFCRITIATTATDSTIPNMTASAAHGQVRRFSTGAEGATGRTPSPSDLGMTPVNAGSSAGAPSSASSARLAVMGGASGASMQARPVARGHRGEIGGGRIFVRLRRDHRRRGGAGGVRQGDLDGRRFRSGGLAARRNDRPGWNRRHVRPRRADRRRRPRGCGPGLDQRRGRRSWRAGPGRRRGAWSRGWPNRRGRRDIARRGRRDRRDRPGAARRMRSSGARRVGRRFPLRGQSGRSFRDRSGWSFGGGRRRAFRR